MCYTLCIGLPAIAARNMMIDSKSESVLLPVVGRSVQTASAALDASNSEGADFLICGLGEDKNDDVVGNTLFTNVKTPIFIMHASCREAISILEMSKFIKSGASGLVISLQDLKSLSDGVMRQLLNSYYAINGEEQDELEILSNLEVLNANNGSRKEKQVAAFVKLEDREKQLLDTEKSVLLEAINTIQKAAPLVIF